MAMSIRAVSLLLRRGRSRQERERTLDDFAAWRERLEVLAPARPRTHKALIIRLDDIGDYLLFRNQLASYKASARWAGYHVTLLGNASWRPFFSAYDADSVDDTIWVEKAQYLRHEAYRFGVWEELRARGFDTAIAPSRTRPLLLDDLCLLAAAPRRTFGSANTYAHTSWNEVSDALYGELYMPSREDHEFEFNGKFSQWLSGHRYSGSRPGFDAPTPEPGRHLVCFVGANTRSRRWPAKRWVEFIERYRDGHSAPVILAGNGAAELAMAERIQSQTRADSVVGKMSLLELKSLITDARALVTNDTMAAHLGVSCKTPTVIVANGVNYERFTDYDRAGIDGVATVYPRVFMARRRRLGNVPHRYTDALTADIASIDAQSVYRALVAVWA